METDFEKGLAFKLNTLGYEPDFEKGLALKLNTLGYEPDFEKCLALKLNTIGYLLSDLQYENNQTHSCDVNENFYCLEDTVAREMEQVHKFSLFDRQKDMKVSEITLKRSIVECDNAVNYSIRLDLYGWGKDRYKQIEYPPIYNEGYPEFPIDIPTITFRVISLLPKEYCKFYVEALKKLTYYY